MAPKLTPNRAYVAKKETEKKEGLADREDTSLGNLHDCLINFYRYILQDLHLLRGLATEQAKSSSSKTPMQKNQKMTRRECMEIICDEIGQCYAATSAIAFKEPALLLHKKMWDIMLRRPPHK